MKAAVLQNLGNMEFTEVEDPKCEAEGLVVKVMASAICGTDLKIYRHGHAWITLPWILGHENAGVVAEIGSGVTGWKIGDRVAVGCIMPCNDCYFCNQGWHTSCQNTRGISYHYPGGFAEYMAIPPEALKCGLVQRIPDNLSFAEAAVAEPLSCVINGQEIIDMHLGDQVVIIGMGTIGCLHALLAKSRGAVKVIGADVLESKRDLVGIFGVDVYINSSQEDLVKRVMEETDGLGATTVIVACSVGKAQEQALSLVRSRGRICFFGGLPKDRPFVNINSNIIHYKEVSVHGAFSSSPRQYQLALDLIISGKIKVKEFITHTFPLQDISEALKMAEKEESLKVVLEPWPAL
ncbi:MAG: D-arabitol-phosphate dehydrogenase [Actinobacteria bacterium]|nr:D-arabitol-phosphate dehydrogenase [Actinomycetota bacterium]